MNGLPWERDLLRMKQLLDGTPQEVFTPGIDVENDELILIRVGLHHIQPTQSRLTHERLNRVTQARPHRSELNTKGTLERIKLLLCHSSECGCFVCTVTNVKVRKATCPDGRFFVHVFILVSSWCGKPGGQGNLSPGHSLRQRREARTQFNYLISTRRYGFAKHCAPKR